MGRRSIRESFLNLVQYRLGKTVELPSDENDCAEMGLETEKGVEKESSGVKSETERPWYSLPYNTSWFDWAAITFGVTFVTFAHPALTNYALFQIALALAITLSSVGPIYMLPLSWVFQRGRPTLGSCMGATLAVAGVAILSFFGR